MKKFKLTFYLALMAGTSVSSLANSTSSVWDNSYGGQDKSYDINLLTLREKITPTFQVFQFKDPVNGVEMDYNLYIPEGYDSKNRDKEYPLVMFIADASTAGKGVKAPLMQGYGGIIWATESMQKKQPAFVLVPSFKNKAVTDNWQINDEVDTTVRLLENIVNSYSIDSKRLYATGQSMGGMISFYLNSRYPDLFAASMFVGSQWDVNVLAPLAKAKFIYTVSAADPKASKGMAELGEMLKQLGVTVGETEFSALLPQTEQNNQVLALLEKGHKINFIRFSPNTVVPKGKNGKGDEHMYSFDYAYLLEPARLWLMSQSK